MNKSNKKEYFEKYREKNCEKLNKYLKQWRKDHPEYSKEWNEKNPKRRSEINIKSYLKYQKKKLEQKRKYRKTEEAKRIYEKWYTENKEERLKYSKQYHKTNTEKIKEICKKSMNKRKRNLGFVPLNEYFVGSAAHHIDKNKVIYILKEIHSSISHCLETGRNMERINKIAIIFIEEGG